MTYTMNNRPGAAPLPAVPPGPRSSGASAGSGAATAEPPGPRSSGASAGSGAATADGPGERSTADLVRLAAEQISRLVRDELKLAQTELTAKGKRAGVGVGMFGAAGLIALYGVAALLAALIIGLAAVMPAWLAALIVGVVLLVIAGIAAILGRRQVKRAAPPTPSETVRNVKADIDTITEAVKDRGHR